jgi:hypothetical protein
MNVSTSSPSFNGKLKTGNPLDQTFRVADTKDATWKIRNADATSWLRVTPNGCFGDGIFTIAVNIYDTSVVLGTQTGRLFIESINPLIIITVTLTVSAS